MTTDFSFSRNVLDVLSFAMRFAVAFSALESIAMVSSSLVVFVAVEKHLLLLELETKEEEEEEAFGGEEGGQKKHVAIAKFLLLALLFCPLYAQKNKRLRKVFVVILSLFVFFLCVLRSSFVQQN
tara:strand:- start:245 stop:619 length:375 start_codon:yes stop_codon:yes gene_type:complete